MLAYGRIAVGTGCVLAPGVIAGVLTGRESDPGTKLFVRMLGARDLGIGVGVATALTRDEPTRGWLEVSALADGADCVACLLARSHLRPTAFRLAASTAAAAALLHAKLSRHGVAR
ncbi:MAG TPA: hypothetical protein VK919_08755 [Solirubrobacterales bacterium]|nr:hypothetical protein [Solirubrobacterales bacterium]